MRRMGAGVVLAGALCLFATPAQAANKEQQLLMAELRIMQQQQQQLQQSLLVLADSLKLVTGRLDEQAAQSRKALADQRLLIEGMTDTVRVLRERSDDTNVRLSSITQEIESLRQAIASQPQPVAAPAAPAGEAAALPPGSAGAPPAAAPSSPVSPPPNVSPQRAYDSADSDYAAGHWDLAIEGFQSFLRLFPRHANADEAQLQIGNSLFNGGKFREAVPEYQRVISDYPKSNSVPAAYYKLGQVYMRLNQSDLARKAWETVQEQYPGSSEATLAKQALERVK